MKNCFKYLSVICWLVLVCFSLDLYGADEPNEQDIQLAKEKMQRLREAYKEIQQAETELYQLIEESESKEPLLRPTKQALKKTKDFLQVKDHQRFQKYLNSSKDRKATLRLYSSCKGAFMGSRIATLLNDPSQAKLLKKPFLYSFRHIEIESSNLGFDPNDPNDERLWQNIKQVYSKLSSQEYLQKEREYYIKKKGAPEWLPDYAGDVAFADSMTNTYELAIHLLTLQEVRDAEKKVRKLYHKISWTDSNFSWGKMRHILADENNPNNETVIRAVQEHMRFFRTDR